MKTIACFLFTAAAAAAASVAVLPQSRVPGAAPRALQLASDQFYSFGIDYKKPQVLSETFFNPFKVQADLGLAKKEGASVTTESVAEAIGRRGVSGIFYSGSGGTKRAIIGDQVFGVGDELSFPGGDKPGLIPLVAGATVVLQNIGKDSLTVDVSGEGDTPRRVRFSLRNFMQP